MPMAQSPDTCSMSRETCVVGGKATADQRELIDAVRVSVEAGIERCLPGVTVGRVARRCEEAMAGTAYAKKHGNPESQMAGVWGHGLGLGFEPPWIDPSSTVVIEEGM